MNEIYIPPADIQWTGKAGHPFWDGYARNMEDPGALDHDLAYARLRQLGLGHEDAVQGAQRRRGRSTTIPEPENDFNRFMSRMPLSMPIGQKAFTVDDYLALAAAVNQAQAAKPVVEAAVAPMNPNRRGLNNADRKAAIMQILMAANPAGAEQAGPVPVVITPSPGAGAAGPSVAEVVEEVASTPTPSGPLGRRMAMRYGLPALGALLGLYGLGAVANANARDEREVARA